MRNLLRLAPLLAILSGCSLPPPQSKTAPSNVVGVSVEPQAGGFRANFTFPSDSPVWAFHRSALRRTDKLPWRAESWRVMTPGVKLERIGDYDALVSSDGGPVPRSVAIAFTPAAVDLIADYDPALKFTNSTTALFAGVFSAFPSESREGLAQAGQTYPASLSASFTDRGRKVLYRGKQVTRAVDDGQRYVIYGPAQVRTDTAFARVFDPAMPGWLASELDTFTPRLFDRYARSLGAFKGDRPMIVASWTPSDFEGASQGGSVNPGMITIALEGRGLLAPNPQVVAGMRWFIGHESAHFWLGETIRYDRRERAWITEGGADLMAARAVKEFDPAFADARFISRARNDCAKALAQGGVESAGSRAESRPFYACGMVFGLAVEAAGKPRGEDFFVFVRRLIEANSDGEVTRADWFAEARRFGVAEAKLERISLMLDGARPDGAADIAALLDG